MAALAEMKHEWRLLKHDRPGERFDNHRRRMDKGPTWKKVLRGVAGFALVAVGIVFCILPGPGTVGIVLGLALLAGMSRTIARLMDRVEPKLRRVARRAVRFWRTLSTPARITLIGAGVTVVGFAGFVVWRHWVAPMLA
jgi:Putative transmembrane protein (PGPGW)